MEEQGLLFIPDISGFTEFINSVELYHSQHIIQELLEVLLDANQMELEVSEIEGDAILFYKMGASPDLSASYEQVEKMFRAFHKHLELYEQRRTCHCNACISAIHLSLKIIMHFGEFTEYKVKNFQKLIGRDIIVAHQLLKNDIPENEYWLVTTSCIPGSSPLKPAPGIRWSKGIKTLSDSQVSFYFAPLTHLKGS